MRSRQRVLGIVIALAVLAGLGFAGCDSSYLLGIDADQGIVGLVLVGPTCPVPTSDPACEDRPYSGWLTVTHSSGQKVTRVRSNDEGGFLVGLRPGRYVVTPDSGDPFPRGEPEEAEVIAGEFTSMTVRMDSGIR